jgi:hypothetical protein
VASFYQHFGGRASPERFCWANLGKISSRELSLKRVFLTFGGFKSRIAHNYRFCFTFKVRE